MSNPRDQEAGKLQPILYILAPESHKTQISLQKHKYNGSGPGSEGIPEAGSPSDYPEIPHEVGDQLLLWLLLLTPFIPGPSASGAHAMNLEPPVLSLSQQDPHPEDPEGHTCNGPPQLSLLPSIMFLLTWSATQFSLLHPSPGAA